MSQLFASSGQGIGASASALLLPMNMQGWLPLGLTDFIFLLSKRLSRVSSSTTVWKHQFFGAQPSIWSTKLLVILFKFSVSLLVLFFLTSWGVFCFMVHFFTLFSVLLEFHTLRKPFCQHCSNTSTTPYLQSLFPYTAFFIVVFISIGYYILYLYVHCLL